MVKIDNSINVIVLQHPDEVKNAKGSAVIAKLCLENYQSWQGEDFSSNNELNRIIETNSDNICVVYPAKNAVSLNQILHISTDNIEKKIKYVIFIDASWRKAKKIWSLSTNLHHLLTVKLDDDNQSNYRIRKVPADGYLSTVEAITELLSKAERDKDKFQPMIDIFESMIDFQINKMGKATYENNYQNNKN